MLFKLIITAALFLMVGVAVGLLIAPNRHANAIGAGVLIGMALTVLAGLAYTIYLALWF